jgi:hypothetical protein
VGSSIADQATVTGGFNPTGTVTFNLYANPNGTGTPLFTDANEPLVGGVATSAGYTATAAGTDYWVATYNGDSNNSAVTSGTALEPVTITAASPAINTVAGAAVVLGDGTSLSDTATLSGGYNPTGTITFSLYNPSNTIVYTDVVTVTGNGIYSSTSGTSTGSAIPTLAGTYLWKAVYASGNLNNQGASDNGTNENELVKPANGSLSGYVYIDINGDDTFTAGDTGLGGVTLTLTGTDALGHTVTLTTVSSSTGAYSFTGLLAGTYTVTETHPAGYLDERSDVGSTGGTAGIGTISSITFPSGAASVSNNFGELTFATDGIGKGDAATIGFWHNKNGQALINSLNGSSTSTHLAQWLATTFPNLYGLSAGVYAMVTGTSSNPHYLTNAQVAASYNTNFFGVTGQKTNAQVLAVAFAVYSTSTNLSGSATLAVKCGFNVTATGIGLDTYNIGSNGAAFGVANNSVLTINQILAYTNSQSYGGKLYNGITALINMANTVYGGINTSGDIS